MQPARSIELLAPFFKELKIRRVLDYGAGTLRNTLYLARNGFEVTAVDTGDYLPELFYRHRNVSNARSCLDHAFSKGLSKNFALAPGKISAIYDVDQYPASTNSVDLVICTYVLNILGSRRQQARVLQRCHEALRPGGYLFLEVKEKREHNAVHALSLPEVEELSQTLGFRNWLWWRGRISLAGLLQKYTPQG